MKASSVLNPSVWAKIIRDWPKIEEEQSKKYPWGEKNETGGEGTVSFIADPESRYEGKISTGRVSREKDL
jgi:hypothetical protein